MLEKHYQKIKIYLKATIQGDINSFVLCGRRGLGKTYLVSSVLKELGLKENINYISINSYFTPLELYLLLQRVNQLQLPKLLVLDDCEYNLRDRKIISILKSALWEQGNGKRKINYLSSTYKIRQTIIDNFEGKIIFLLNEINEQSPIVSALIDRGLYYQFNPTDQETKQAIRELAVLPYKNIKQEERMKIADYILNKFEPKELSLRSLIKYYNLFISNNNLWRV